MEGESMTRAGEPQSDSPADTPTLASTVQRASERVAGWPEWKRNISVSGRGESAEQKPAEPTPEEREGNHVEMVDAANRPASACNRLAHGFSGSTEQNIVAAYWQQRTRALESLHHACNGVLSVKQEEELLKSALAAERQRTANRCTKIVRAYCVGINGATHLREILLEEIRREFGLGGK